MSNERSNDTVPSGYASIQQVELDQTRANLTLVDSGGSDSAYLDIVQFIQIIWRNLWLIIILAILGGAIGYLLIEAQTPVYESRASVAVLPNTSGSATIPRPIENINIALGTYVQVLRSNSLQDNVRNALAQQFTASELQDTEVDIQPVENSAIISIVVRSPNKILAQAFATGLMSQAIDENPLPLFQLSYRVYVLDSPHLPDHPAYPNKPVSLVLAVVGSVVLGVALAFLRETYRRRRR